MTRLCLALFAASLLAPAVAIGAQAVAADSVCSYDRCAVWIERGTLRRGASGAVVIRDGFLNPMRLVAFVGGSDSATIWADRFQRRANTGAVLSVLGLLSVVIAASSQYVRTRNLAPGVRDDATAFQAALWFGGAAAMAAGLWVRASAEPSRGRAVWWYNRRFVLESGR